MVIRTILKNATKMCIFDNLPTIYFDTCRWRRSSEMKRVHFAEELNEYNHLLIMESMGGDEKWQAQNIMHVL